MPGAVDGPESAMARAVHCSRQDVFVLRSYVFIARYAQSSSDDLDLGHEQAGQIWPGSSSPSGSPDRQSSPRLWSQCRHPSRRRTGWGGGVARQRGGRDERRKSGGAAEQGAPSESGAGGAGRERSGRRLELPMGGLRCPAARVRPYILTAQTLEPKWYIVYVVV